MKAIIILHNGVQVDQEILSQIVAQIAVATSATSDINVTQLTDAEVAAAILTPKQVIAVDSVDDALQKGANFILSRYYSYISSKDYVGLGLQIVVDIQNDIEDGMVKNAIIALAASDSKKVMSLGISKPVLETLKKIHQSKLLQHVSY